jgi:2-keto-3-deoxy-L-fuconate dehydrogenase
VTEKNERGITGAIVNIASIAGMVGVKQRFAYCTSKGAIIAMTRQLAIDYPKTLRVNAICPGTVETPFVEGIWINSTRHEKEKTRAELKARQPIGRLGQPEEIASMVRYLASDEAGSSSTARCLPLTAAGRLHEPAGRNVSIIDGVPMTES